MSMYAYKDSARTQELTAKKAQEQDKGTRFYCPNPLCDAHLFIANLNGLKSPYFTANRNGHQHIDDCDCQKASKNFNPNNFREEGFILENAISALMQVGQESATTIALQKSFSKSPGAPTLPHTISQLYWMSKSYSCEDTYNNTLIGTILLDKRSFYMYPKGVFGWHLIEAYCKPRYFNTDGSGKIFLELSHNEITYNFILNFDNNILFRSIERKLRNNRNRKIIVAGKWDKADKYNSFSTLITSKKQITVI